MKWPIVTTIAVLAACSSSNKKEAYERLASTANPILESMRPTAARMLALPEHDHRAIMSACASADDHIKRLRHVTFDKYDVDRRRHPKYQRVEVLATDLFRERNFVCYRNLQFEYPTSYPICARWCREYWSMMIDSVEVIHEAAKREGVHFVSLKPEQGR